MMSPLLPFLAVDSGSALVLWLSLGLLLGVLIALAVFARYFGLWIRDWDFNWQEQYMYARELKLPKGTTIVVDCYFDNSKDNPLNPNSPPKRVTWGPQSKDCMALCQFQFTCDSLAELSAVNREYVRYLLGQSAEKRFAGSKNVSE